MKKNRFFIVLLCLLLAPGLATAMNKKKKNNLKEPLLRNKKEEPLHLIPEWEEPGETVVFCATEDLITLFQKKIESVQKKIATSEENESDPENSGSQTHSQAIENYQEIISKLEDVLNEIKHEKNMMIIFNEKEYEIETYRNLANEKIEQLREEITKWGKVVRCEKRKQNREDAMCTCMRYSAMSACICCGFITAFGLPASVFLCLLFSY